MDTNIANHYQWRKYCGIRSGYVVTTYLNSVTIRYQSQDTHLTLCSESDIRLYIHDCLLLETHASFIIPFGIEYILMINWCVWLDLKFIAFGNELADVCVIGFCSHVLHWNVSNLYEIFNRLNREINDDSNLSRSWNGKVFLAESQYSMNTQVYLYRWRLNANIIFYNITPIRSFISQTKKQN